MEIIYIEKMKKKKTEREEKGKEAEKEKADIKDIQNQELILDQVLTPFQKNQGQDPDQGRIIEMAANLQTIQDSIGEKKGSIFL